MCKFVKNNYTLFKTDERAQYKRKIVQKPLVVPQNRLKMCDMNCYFMAIKIYNKLPNNVRELRGSEFNKNLYNWLCDRCFYNLEDYFNFKNK